MKTTLFWILALLIAGAAMFYQKSTGPTYALTGQVVLNDSLINYSFERSYGGEGNHTVEVEIGSRQIVGMLEWKRYPTDEEFQICYMMREDSKLIGILPHQPPAGKLLYRVTLAEGVNYCSLPDMDGVVIRFKGGVPTAVLLPHVLLMILSMIMAVRTGLEAFRRDGNLKILTLLTFLVFLVGGGILGPLVQKFAFGVYWSGIPLGWDLTDNKILVTLLGWLIALVVVFRKPRIARVLVLMAAVITMAVYAIPHSMQGSELDYAAYDSLGVIDNIPR